MSDKKKIVAIVLNFNSSKDTENCIKYLKAQTYSNFDIVIVDNCSTQEDYEYLKKKCNDIKIIRNYENRGYSAGNNCGIRYARENNADAVLIINPDVEIRDKNYVEMASMNLFYNDEIVVVGSRILGVDGEDQSPIRESNFKEEFWWGYELIKSKLKKSTTYIEFSSEKKYCDKISGCCFFIKIDFLDLINGLDEKVFMYCEEPILAACIRKRNKKILFLPEIVAYHMHYTNRKANSSSRMVQFIESRKYYIKEYSDLSKLKKSLLLISLELKKCFFIILSKRSS